MVKPLSLLSVVSLVAGAFALPQASGISDEAATLDFKPGPGLPTVEELGLTTEDLLKPIPEEVLASVRTSSSHITHTETAQFLTNASFRVPAEADYASLDAGSGSSASSDGSSSLTKRQWTPACKGPHRASLASANACYNYLLSLGTTACTVPDSGSVWLSLITMCEIGDAKVTGKCFPPNCPASSWCQHAAHGVAWVMQNCNVDNFVGGEQAAWGNGHLIIGVQSR
ncbi:hypothetical protein CC1G_08505 [Coprinopsis cinerea okayama7|uniref:Secreted protein n=1 Tax=Coprinopsis cinerea (strain Okayama-7 / 130 / ATCC MYA-4618 / FGSC 9003) TaxID=240176 RepID=A8ND14_COPC7|nr:hypothetical protein CC1G_08505 [Coprinopsis cinerea okayama7\|eukprot:XP_001832677.1 hypothetical protein CC1G_08505 [Coprinopsis cinerea okayama7\